MPEVRMTHSKDTLDAAIFKLREILFEPTKRHINWTDDANHALAVFADTCAEALNYREETLSRVELTPLGESIVEAAGGTGFQPVAGSLGFQPERDPGDECEAGLPDDEIPFGTPATRPGSGPLPLTIEQQHDLLRSDGRRQSALRSIYSVCTLLTDEDDFGIHAAIQFAYAMKEVAEQALAYTGEVATVANPRPE